MPEMELIETVASASHIRHPFPHTEAVISFKSIITLHARRKGEDGSRSKAR